MILTCLLAVIAAASGIMVTYAYDPDIRLFSRLCAGMAIGFALLGIIGFVYASLLGLTTLSLRLTATTLLCPLALLAAAPFRRRLSMDIRAIAQLACDRILQPDRRTIGFILTSLLGATLLWRFVSMGAFERSGAIWTGSINNVGDLPFHVSVISGFVYGQNFPPEHTQFAGARLTYPFIADFLTAMFMRAGASLTRAMFVQNFVLILTVIGLLYHWALKLTRDAVAAITSLMLLLFSGGLGWWLLFDDVRRSAGNPLVALINLTHEYTTEAACGLRWGNLLETILLPQRSFLLGLPLVIIVWTVWWQAIEEEQKTQPSGIAPSSQSSLSLPMRRMLGAGLLTGLLPLVHTSSFVVIMAMALCLTLLFRRWQCWIAFFAIALALGLPQLWWFGHNTSVRAHNLFAWHFGWDKGAENIGWFWFKNTGLFIPLLLIALVWGGRTPVVPPRLRLFSLPFLLCFLIPNVAKLTPWIWDSIKVLIFWYVASVPLVALLLVRLSRSGRMVHRMSAIVLLISMTLAGSLDVWRVLAKRSQWIVFDHDAVACADLIIEQSPPSALILHAPTNNHAVFLTGRRSLMGLAFIPWTHGLDFGSREQDIQRIYAGGPDAEKLMAHYSVDYAVVGPAERNGLLINEHFFDRYPAVGEINGCRLYQITQK